MPKPEQVCIVCENSDATVPLIRFTFQGKELAICPQHLPILIHKPGQLAGKLPGVENIPPTEEH